VRIHGTTGEAPITRFEPDEVHRLTLLGGRPSFGWLRELTRVVGADAVEIDTTATRCPGVDRRACGGDGRGRRGADPQSTSNRRVAVCGPSIPPTSTVLPVAMALSAERRSRHRRCRYRLHHHRCRALLPNTKQQSHKASDGARKESAGHSLDAHTGVIATHRHPRPARQPSNGP
jgi:hypothetical protein